MINNLMNNRIKLLVLSKVLNSYIMQVKLFSKFIDFFKIKFFYHRDMTKFKSCIKQSFIFGIILDKLNINDNVLQSSGDNYHYNFALGIFILSLICLLNFINVVGYLSSIYLINKYDIDTKYPKLKKIIKFYENSSLIFVII